MSDGYRNGAYALGLVTGIGGALNLFLWLGYLAQDQVRPHSLDGQINSETGLWWWHWSGHYISSGDTLAQWIMAFFTIVATGVLILTLRSANQTNMAAVNAAEAAIEANQILRQEQRPWISFEIIEFGRFQCIGWENGAKSVLFFPKVKLENLGRSPAINVHFSVWVWEGRTFDSDAALEEMVSGETSELHQGHIVFPDNSITLENMGAGHAVRDIKGVKQNPNATRSLWFVALVKYRFGDLWFHTSQVFQCETVEFSEGNNVHYLAPSRWHWNDTYV